MLNLPASEARAARRRPRHATGPGRPIGIVTSSLGEAACWRAGRTQVAALTFASGSSGHRARYGVQQMLERGAVGLLSFGLATGLAPVLRPGDLLVASSVVLPPGGSIRVHQAWRDELLGRLASVSQRVTVARVVGGERLALSVSEKRRAFMATAAAAIDTESRAVAEAAEAAGLPFLVVRAIVDPAEEARPEAAIAGLRADGGIRALPLAAGLLARPGEIAAMWRFAQSGRLGLNALRQVVRLMPAPPEPVALESAFALDAPGLAAVASGA